MTTKNVELTVLFNRDPKTDRFAVRVVLPEGNKECFKDVVALLPNGLDPYTGLAQLEGQHLDISMTTVLPPDMTLPKGRQLVGHYQLILP